MKYDTPELTALSTAIDAIQVTAGLKARARYFEGVLTRNDTADEYEDWE